MSLFFRWLSLVSLSCFALMACQSVPDNAAPSSALTKPNQTAASYNLQLGVGYLEQQNIKRAKEKFLLALQQAPDWPPALEGMGLYLETTGEVAQARNYYLKALRYAPHSGRAHNNYGTFLCRQKQYDQAIKEFELAVADPDYLNTAEAYENAGICAEAIPRHPQALAFFEKAHYRDPLRPVPLLKLAERFFKEKRYVEAERYLQSFNEASNPTSDSLWLAIQVAGVQHKFSAMQSDARLLKAQFPTSLAYQAYLKSAYAKKGP